MDKATPFVMVERRVFYQRRRFRRYEREARLKRREQ
jgi:hypothetical protein